MAIEKFTLVNYFDVWGNEEDGWEVNNLCKEGIIELDENATHEDMINAMIDFGFLKEGVTENMLDILDNWEMIEFFDNSNGCPLCRLELIN